MKLLEFKEAFPESTIMLDEPLSHYSHTKTGGPADAVVHPKTADEIVAMVRWIAQRDIPLTVLGNGSNLIIQDGGIRGIVMVLTDNTGVRVEGERVIAASGTTIAHVTEVAADAGLTGLEFACGIPGSTGGAIYMNAGAYGGEITDVFESVKVVTRQGELREYSHEDMDFAYRHSALQESSDIVLEVTFKLEPGQVQEIRLKMEELMELRWSKQPLEYPSCGSVFKRPEGYYAGPLIIEAGLQGLQWGGAQVSTKHAGFIVNVDHATATDYVELIHYIQEKVYEVHGVRLEREVRIIGEEPQE